MARVVTVTCKLQGAQGAVEAPVECTVILTEGTPGELHVSYTKGKSVVQFSKQVEVSFERFADVLKNPVALVRYLTQLTDLFRR